MLRFRLISLTDELSAAVRTTLRSPQYGHPAHVERASGTGPCRACLRTFRVGEEDRILFTYQPFHAPALPAPGPVFIHWDTCSRYEGPEVPEEVRELPLAVEGWSAEGRLVSLERVGTAGPEETLRGLLGRPEVAYAHLRNAEVGCFIARVERAD